MPNLVKEFKAEVDFQGVGAKSSPAQLELEIRPRKIGLKADCHVSSFQIGIESGGESSFIKSHYLLIRIIFSRIFYDCFHLRSTETGEYFIGMHPHHICNVWWQNFTTVRSKLRTIL